MAMKEPVEVTDEEHEHLIGRVAAIDVAKAFGKVCTRVPHQSASGRRVTKVWDVEATLNAVTELSDRLAEFARGRMRAKTQHWSKRSAASSTTTTPSSRRCYWPRSTAWTCSDRAASGRSACRAPRSRPRRQRPGRRFLREHR
ncbi:hypothetical protein [Microtetraspora sp. NBRC 16547]|uniref:hypothetical protein n=1 Tax=Microtetraspora sp. NBRC 16547 TaxID=3030993 RepID=UPI0024A527D3|nr:hypothetical protein [Microtetraspora sp. NBRC 16547]GLW98943.1 hypothetical protein Misp02_30300 [Microtetraspora sp. NBRC 16547]